jgi:hypothetical protein
MSDDQAQATPEEKSEGGALRKQLEAALSELGQYKAKERQATIQQELVTRGYNPKGVTLIPKDIEPSALEGWLQENGEALARTPQQSSEDPPPQAAQRVSPDDLADLKQFQNVAVPQPGTSGSDLLTALRAAKTPEEANAIFRQGGGRGDLISL